MKVANFEQISDDAVTMEGSSGCRIRCLIGPDDGAPSFTMRQFEVAPGGNTPRHAHAYEHEVFVLEGEGIVLDSRGEHRLCGRARPSSSPPTRSTSSATRARPAEVPLPDSASPARHGGPCVAACGCG